MRRVAIVLLIGLAISALLLKDHWIGFVQPWLPELTPQSRYLGYVEGETTLIAAPVAGRLAELPLERGAGVKKGALAFKLDTAEVDAAVTQAEASVADAEAQLANLQTGKRQVEQDVIRAQTTEAEAALHQGELDFARASRLASAGVSTRVSLDQADSQVRQLRARVESLKAQLAAGDLGGRTQEIKAAEAKVAEAKASLAQAQSRQCDRAPLAPIDAQVEDTFFNVGEWVGAGQPVVSLLAPDKVKLRFFVPETDVARAKPGTTVHFACDGCSGGLTASITYVAPRAEFTPPVIYSESARQKLVFLVEAHPSASNGELRPGLPVEVQPLEGAAP